MLCQYFLHCFKFQKLSPEFLFQLYFFLISLPMNQKRQSLHSDLLQFSHRKHTQNQLTNSIAYETVLSAQKKVIDLLQKQVKQLRQYLIYFSDSEDVTFKEDIKTNESQSLELQNSSFLSSEKSIKKTNGLKSLITEVMKILRVKTIEQVIPKLKKNQEKVNQKVEPVFIEKIKEKEVPVIVEKIKEIQKEILVEVMVEKQVIKEVIVEKIVQKPVPIFREKIIQKFVERPLESSTFSCEEKSRLNESFTQENQEESFKRKKINFSEMNKSTNFHKKQYSNRDHHYDSSFSYRRRDKNRYREKYE